MNIVSMKDVPKNPRISPLFTGKDVTVQPLVPRRRRLQHEYCKLWKGHQKQIPYP